MGLIKKIKHVSYGDITKEYTVPHRKVAIKKYDI